VSEIDVSTVVSCVGDCLMILRVSDVLEIFVSTGV
jgi:hypothetical protein